MPLKDLSILACRALCSENPVDIGLPGDAVSCNTELSLGDCNGDPVDGVAVSTRSPGVGEFIAVAVVLDAVGCHPDLTALEQNLERFAGGDAGAELAGHDRRGTASFLEIYAGFVGQVVAVQQGRGKADEETDGFFQISTSSDLEILFECHLARQEIEQPGADAQWGDGYSRNAVFCAIREDIFACFKSEEIEAVDVEINIAEELFEVFRVDATRENVDVDFRVDVARHSGENVNFGLVDAAHACADLAIEVLDAKRIEIGDVEFSDAQSRKRQKVNATNATHSGNGDPLVAQCCLLLLGNPADIP